MVGFVTDQGMKSVLIYIIFPKNFGDYVEYRIYKIENSLPGNYIFVMKILQYYPKL